MLTVETLRNPARKSGFDHVRISSAPGRPTTLYRAQAGGRPQRAGQRGNSWSGPSRRTPEQAAQDYCDMVNLRAVGPGGKVAVRTNMRRALHVRRQRALTPAEKVAKDIARDARLKGRGHPGFVYLIAEDRDGPLTETYVKIGWTAADPPEQRMGDFQAGNPRRLRMIAAIPGTTDLEHELQARFGAQQVLGEWFVYSPEIQEAFGL